MRVCGCMPSAIEMLLMTRLKAHSCVTTSASSFCRALMWAHAVQNFYFLEMNTRLQVNSPLSFSLPLSFFTPSLALHLTFLLFISLLLSLRCSSQLSM